MLIIAFIKVRKHLIFFGLCFFFFSKVTIAQDFLKEQIQISNLMVKGRFKEALLATDQLIKILGKTKNKEKKETIDYLRNIKAVIYENIGSYAKAEQIYKELLARGSVDTEDIYNNRIKALHSLSLLYERMGNELAATNTLEELVVIEYGHNTVKDKRSEYIDYYINLARLNYKEVNGNMNGFDSLAIADEMADNFDNRDTTDVDPRSMAILDAVIQFQGTAKNKAPSAKQLHLLRQGELTLGGRRNGYNFNDPWSEVQRLFKNYLRMNNVIGAEQLIKKAIAIDDHPQVNENPMNTMLNNIMPKSVMNYITKKTSKVITTNMKQLLSVNNKYGGTDIFYIQNKVLLAQLYQQSNRTEEFKLLSDTISNLCKKLEQVSHPLIINALAEAYTSIGQDQQALRNYQKIISIYKNSIKDKFVNFIQYLSALQESVKLYKAQGNYGKAKLLLDEALAYDKKIAGEKYAGHMTRLLAMAQWHEDTGDLKGAEQYCTNILAPVMQSIRQNFSFLSEAEKRSLLNNQTAFFDFSVSLLQTDPHASEQFIQQTFNRQMELKGLVLTDERRILEQLRKSGNLHLKQLLDKWQVTRAAIAWQYSQSPSLLISQRIDSLKKIANDQEKDIGKLSASFASYRNDQPADLQHLTQFLKPGTAAIEFVRFKYYHKQWTDTVYYGAFLILPNLSSPKFIPLCEEKELLKILGTSIQSSKSYIDQLYGNGVQPAKNTIADRKSDRLYDLLWKPISSYLSGVNEISLSPAGLLNRINFNAIPFSKTEYLIDQYEIKLYANLAQLTAKKRLIEGTDAVLFGNIDYGTVQEGKHWSPLQTDEEVHTAANLLMANNQKVEVITDTGATEEKLKQLTGHSPAILHIATHGFSKPPLPSLLLTDDPMMRTGIIMAGANRVWSGQNPDPNQEDGIVSSYEIAGLDLSNTQLVVLSSCQTALGDIVDNEGVFGMQRGFKLAGAGSLVLGLWNLENDGTTQFLTHFYKNKTSAPNLSYSQAFHQAQKQLRQKQSPYYWAGLVFIE